MKNLIKAEEQGATMTSLEIAQVTGKRHDNVLAAIRKMEAAWTKISHLNFKVAEYKDEQGKLRPMYELTKTECLYIATKFNDEARAKLVLRWEELEMKERQNVPALPDFTNPAEAARAWAAEYEAKQQALLEAKEAQDHVKMLVHNGKTYTSSEIAKELGMKSAIALNKLLEEKHVQYKQNGTWLLYSEHCEKGLTSVKQIQLDNGTIQYDRRWTGKGRDFILNLIRFFEKIYYICTVG